MNNCCIHCGKHNETWTNDGYSMCCSHCLKPQHYRGEAIPATPPQPPVPEAGARHLDVLTAFIRDNTSYDRGPIWYALEFVRDSLAPPPAEQPFICNTSYRHQPHDGCDGKPNAPKFGLADAIKPQTAAPAVQGQAAPQQGGAIDKLAEEIAAELFIGGLGKRADRLELKHGARVEDERGGGGWCERAVVDVIRRHLKGWSR